MTAYNALIAKVTEYLSRDGILNASINPASYAAQMVFETEIRNDELSFEIPGRYTLNGHPNSVSFDAIAYAAQLHAETE